MTNKLEKASSQLGSALDEYLDACASVYPPEDGGNKALNLHRSVESEWHRTISHRTKLDRAQEAISIIRKHTVYRGITTIKDLPHEIITHIFHLIIAGQPCLTHHTTSSYKPIIKYPQYPDCLSHICSSWRRIAVNSPALWAHIDIALDHSLNPSLFERASAYASRAGSCPLSIHISNTRSTREKERHSLRQTVTDPILYEAWGDWEDLQEFKCLNALSRIKTLEVDLYLLDGLRDCHFSMLEYFLARCEPGIFTQYTTRVWTTSVLPPVGGPFIEPANEPRTIKGVLLSLPSRHFETIWLGTSSIRVNGLCPHWTSKAYHGLVELHLGLGAPKITESQLVDILKSSPELRVLHINADIMHPSPYSAPITPVSLSELEELTLIQLWPDDSSNQLQDPGNFVRWIAPGRKPFKLTSFGNTLGEFPEFCARSNITQLHIEIWEDNTLGDIVRRCPGLQTLILSAFDFGDPELKLILLPTDNGQRPVSATQIDHLYLLDFEELLFEDILATIEQYSARQLTIWKGGLTYYTDEGMKTSKNTREIRAKLSVIPSAQCIVEYLPGSVPCPRFGDFDWVSPSY
ncbi:hypothetical protein RSOLAG1IB_03833 [Rhizoctonia solani AG-1 IB]|uniref:Uncharacterized protein n=1 Tax=Thanatephorus cucumeris (strain AG1-IB / isolate 7/3/14) TaxID=1108050 RepID=A0A0B7FSG1_THACB|nr:hypothetical protein RSOLAG1IB_03833 [Rhizoctonia solani AG-1 IB]